MERFKQLLRRTRIKMKKSNKSLEILTTIRDEFVKEFEKRIIQDVFKDSVEKERDIGTNPMIAIAENENMYSIIGKIINVHKNNNLSVERKNNIVYTYALKNESDEIVGWQILIPPKIVLIINSKDITVFGEHGFFKTINYR